MPSEGATRISGGKLFQRRGATAEKARFLFFSFWASLGVSLLSLTSWLAQVTRIDLGEHQHFEVDAESDVINSHPHGGPDSWAP